MTKEDKELQLAARDRILSRLSYDAKVAYLMKNEDPTKQNWIKIEKELNKLQ